MKGLAMKYGLPVAIVLTVAVYYMWPSVPVWTVFQVPEEAGSENAWLADGFESQEECESYIRILAGASGTPRGLRLVCGYDCRSLRSAPNFETCEMMGSVHDIG